MGEDANRLRALIADDSAVTRFGVRAALERAGIEVCAEAVDAESAVRLALSERPDVCLLDVMMPAGGGIRAVREIVRGLPETPILMLTGSEAGEDVLGALHEGASGYVLKDEDLGAIIEAVRATAAGDAPISKRAVQDLIDQTRERERRVALAGGRGADLTDRQWEVLELLAGKCSEQEVALRLGIDEPTVGLELAAAGRKLGTRDRGATLALVLSLRSP